ncbi:hypothetical protein M514_06955 [Trichuris suis]|uniref:GPI mannosyltransferase 2 n=1 Tax=Trichuris suis TaxID=68888 RepID=A0A085MWM4_9BILA|nr:hypothetical protein M514_06955 [Trichuris suis]
MTRYLYVWRAVVITGMPVTASVKKEREGFAALPLLLQSCFVAWLLQFIFNHVLPDHNAEAFRSPQIGSTYLADRVVDFLFSGYTRWDSQHFLHIATIGYTFENNAAFFPLLPGMIRILNNAMRPWISFFKISDYQLSVISGVLLVNVAFVLSGIFLYRVVLLLDGRERFCRLCVVLHCLSPATSFIYWRFCLSCPVEELGNYSIYFAYAQERGYNLLCQLDRLDWCHYLVPFSYSAIQKRYWNVGLLGYYQWKKLPCFMLSLPTLCLFWSSLFIKSQEPILMKAPYCLDHVYANKEDGSFAETFFWIFFAKFRKRWTNLFTNNIMVISMMTKVVNGCEVFFPGHLTANAYVHGEPRMLMAFCPRQPNGYGTLRFILRTTRQMRCRISRVLRNYVIRDIKYRKINSDRSTRMPFVYYKSAKVD